jgi:hypothetical protein
MQANDQFILKRRPRSRFSSTVSVLILALIFALLIAGWSLFWFLAAQQTEALLDAWTKREKSVDRIWTCPNRRIAGYPFGIEIICEKPGFSGEVLGRQLTGGVNAFHATASLFHPDKVEVLAAPPFELRSDDGDGEINLQWSVMRVRLDGLPQDVGAVSVEGSDVTLRGGLKGLGALAGRAGSASGTVAIVPERRADDVYTFHLALDDASVPALDALLGSTPPDAIRFDGTVTKANFGVAGTVAERLEHWRLAGGHIEFTEAAVTRGATRLAARGALQLDDQHRPQGLLDAEFAGAEPLLKRYGVNPSLVAAGSLLSALLGGKPNGAAASAGGPPSLHLPVTLQSGLVTIGPVRTSLAVPALY